MSYSRKGNTTSKKVRRCETVSAGAFFPQLQRQVPQKKVGQRRAQPMLVPAGILAYRIMGHPSYGFTFRAALFNGPPHATAPDEGAQGCTRRGMTDRVCVHWLSAHCSLDHQPNAPLWKP